MGKDIPTITEQSSLEDVRRKMFDILGNQGVVEFAAVTYEALQNVLPEELLEHEIHLFFSEVHDAGHKLMRRLNDAIVERL